VGKCMAEDCSISEGHVAKNLSDMPKHCQSVRMPVYMCVYAPNSLCCRGSGSVSSVLGTCPSPMLAPSVYEILRAGAVNRDGHIAPIYAKVVCQMPFAGKTHMTTHIWPPNCLWPAGCLLGDSWMPPGCSWMRIGCLLQKYTCLLVQPAYMSSCTARRHVFLLSKTTFPFVEREDMAPCPTSRHVFLLNKETCLLVQQETRIHVFLFNKTCLRVQHDDIFPCSTRRHVFFFNLKPCIPVEQEDMCCTRRHVFLVTSKTCLLVEQENMCSC